MTLVDSSVWIDYFRGTFTPETNLLNELLPTETIAIGDLILTEVLQGASSERDFVTLRQKLSPLRLIVIGGEKIAIRAAQNYRYLRANGVTVRKTIDTLIATRCIEDGLALLYSDRDFDPFVSYCGLQTAFI